MTSQFLHECLTFTVICIDIATELQCLFHAILQILNPEDVESTFQEVWSKKTIRADLQEELARRQGMRDDLHGYLDRRVVGYPAPSPEGRESLQTKHEITAPTGELQAIGNSLDISYQ